MLRPLVLAVSLVVAMAMVLGDPVSSRSRGLLWRVVEACVLDHNVTGLALPCLFVETGDDAARGYAVIRSPLERVHVIVTPTFRTIGIEAPRLRGPDAPNYFNDAWSARRFVAAALPRPPDRADFALAVNSRFGRSQDQLHIHVACIRREITDTLAALAPKLRDGAWTRIKVLPRAPLYWARFVPGDDLAKVNVFDEVASGLSVPASGMDEMTIVVVGMDAATDHSDGGFAILARKRIPHSNDEAHGEALIDHDCSAFARP